MIYFFNTMKIENYKVSPKQYQSMKGRELISYYYWILKNAGKKVQLVHDIKNVTDSQDSYIIFHYDENKHIGKLKRIKKCQWVSDRPDIADCFMYLVINATLVQFKQRFYVHHPLPVITKKCKPVFPPKIFSCICHSIVLSKEIRERKTELEKEFGVTIRVQHMDWFNKGDEDVFFMVREPCNQPGHKPATRLFISKAMGVPAVLSEHSAFTSFGKPNNDFIRANNYDEFKEAIRKLTTDKEFFESYIPKSEITVDSVNQEIIEQFSNIFKGEL